MSPRTARRLLGGTRLAVAAVEIVALVGNFEYVLGFRLFATANFFSYFTVQSAFAAVVVLIVAGWLALTAPKDPPWLGVVRTCVTVYVIVSGIVFGVIVVQASSYAYRVDVPWSDTLLHFVVPALIGLTWTVDSILAVNPPVPWTTVGWVLLFPAAWLVFALWRGSDVGWYPYFFLDETQVGGWPGVVFWCLVCLVIFLAVTALLVTVNRWLWRRARARRAPRLGTRRRPATPVASPASRR
ncbi:Pr6Pr family membrane protein [Agromyces larvae]|uniref:Pr6Pr family membrane protein n=1 Tax=Agromyces larvae TaxID=2929802 RepID=A0ABY4BXG7_9MICO|nr:Pr6Pr family membrane protein [Agromyces larvae]UOE43925.1 Pr6Pr family membrane protein [Agromyces larvae]